MLVYLKSCTFNFLNLYGTDCQNEIQSKTEIETWVTWRTFQRNLKSIRNQPPPRPIFSVFNYLLMCDIGGGILLTAKNLALCMNSVHRLPAAESRGGSGENWMALSLIREDRSYFKGILPAVQLRNRICWFGFRTLCLLVLWEFRDG